MCVVWLDRRFFASSTQAPLAEFEEIVEPFVSPFTAVASAVQLRPVLILDVAAKVVVLWSRGRVVLSILDCVLIQALMRTLVVVQIPTMLSPVVV